MGAANNKQKTQEKQQTLLGNQSIKYQEEQQEDMPSEAGSQSSEEDIYDDEANNGDLLIMVSRDNLKKYPYNCIGVITAENSDGTIKSKGTAFLISSKLILTSAHVVMDKNSNHHHPNLKFYIDFDKILKNPYQIKAVRLPPEYAQKSEAQRKKRIAVMYDYALCMLKKEVKRDKYIQLANKFNNDLQKIMIAGYPGLTISGNHIQTQMKYSCGQDEKSILSISTKFMRINHILSTESGHSGSPLIVNQSYAVGIHKGTINKNKNGLNPNTSVLFHSKMINNIKKWSAEMDKSESYKAPILDYLQMKSKNHYHKVGDQIYIQQQRSTHLYQRFPFCCIGRIKSKNTKTNKSLYTNGILVSQNLVLTVTSGIINISSEEELNDLEIIFSLGIKNKDTKLYEVEKYQLHPETLRDIISKNNTMIHENFLQKIKNDFCLLKLKESIKCPKYMPLLVNYSKAEQASFYGFTYSDTIKDFNDFLSGKKAQGAISSISIDKKIVEHRFQTQKGQAGSPLMVRDHLIGFHKFKYQKQGKSIKGARLITIDLIQDLYQWNQKLKGAPFEVFYYTSKGEIQKVSGFNNLTELYWKDIKKLE